MDAVPFVIAHQGRRASRKPVEQYDMLRSLREFLQWRQGDAIILAEANVLPETDMEYFGDDGDRMHMMFNFQVNQHLFYALAAGGLRGRWQGAEGHEASGPATAQWGLFLRNHDELDLGRLTRRTAPAGVRGVRARARACSSTTAASAGGSRRCSTATGGGSSSPTA